MKGFVQLIGYLLGAIPVIGAIAAVVIAVKLFILCLPVIIGLLALLFVVYVFFVGLIHLGDDKKQ